MGRLVRLVWSDLEPDTGKRLDGLANVGIDETSYRKGHTYITVIVNHDTNTVVWAHDGYGKEVLELFFKELTEEQRATIRVVTGDGAKWITDCVKEYCPDADRCVDPFHVVEWADQDRLRLPRHRDDDRADYAVLFVDRHSVAGKRQEVPRRIIAKRVYAAKSYPQLCTKSHN